MGRFALLLAILALLFFFVGTLVVAEGFESDSSAPRARETTAAICETSSPRDLTRCSRSKISSRRRSQVFDSLLEVKKERKKDATAKMIRQATIF